MSMCILLKCVWCMCLLHIYMLYYNLNMYVGYDIMCILYMFFSAIILSDYNPNLIKILKG